MIPFLRKSVIAKDAGSRKFLDNEANVVKCLDYYMIHPLPIYFELRTPHNIPHAFQNVSQYLDDSVYLE
ncbi:hypothetical protein LINPERHAP2_LOCUS31099 [Linum perenne]